MLHLSSIPVMVEFFVFGLFSTRHAMTMRHAKDPETLEFTNASTFYNEFLVSILFFSCGLLWPFLYIPTQASEAGIDLLYNVSSLFILGFSANWLIQCSYNYFSCQKNPAEKQQRLEEQANLLASYRVGAYSTAVDIKRKVLHVIPGTVILAIQILAIVLNGVPGFYNGVGIDKAAFCIFGEVIVGSNFIFMFQYADLLRLQSFYQLPPWAKRWFFSSLKKNEMKSFSSATTLILALFPFVMGPAQILLTLAFVSSLADAASSLFGRRFGKHVFPRGSTKTIEGYVAGAVTAFLIAMLFLNWFNESGFSQVVIILTAIAIAVVVFLIDVTTKTLWDNILNPLLLGAVVVVLLSVL